MQENWIDIDGPKKVRNDSRHLSGISLVTRIYILCIPSPYFVAFINKFSERPSLTQLGEQRTHHLTVARLPSLIPPIILPGCATVRRNLKPKALGTLILM